jgi:hypothetical protein
MKFQSYLNLSVSRPGSSETGEGRLEAEEGIAKKR